jgi:hypothetical protein
VIKEIIIDADNSFIGAWILPDLAICDNLINFFEDNPNTRIGEVLNNEVSSIVKTTKDSIDLPLLPNYSLTQPYLDALQVVVEEYKKKYTWANETSPWRIEAVNLQKYNPGGAYFSWHCERNAGGFIGGNRHLVFMTYLNDVTDEGETEFFYQKVKVKPQKGLTLIWPVDWTHTHRGCPSMTQTKYIATGWFTFAN